MNESTSGIGHDVVAEMTRRIVETIHPKKVVLFGSRARGEARADSDVDLLVIVDSQEPRHRRALPLYRALWDILIGTDILVYTPQEVDEWKDVQQAFVTTAMREGRVLYEKQG